MTRRPTLTRRQALLLTTLSLCLPWATSLSTHAPLAHARGSDSGAQNNRKKGPTYQALIEIAKAFEKGSASNLAGRIAPKGKLTLALDGGRGQAYEKKHAENKLETWFDTWTAETVKYRSHEGKDGRSTGTFDVTLRRKGHDGSKKHRYVVVVQKVERDEKKIFHLVKIARV